MQQLFLYQFNGHFVGVFFYYAALGEWFFAAANELVLLMAFACEQHYIAFADMAHDIVNCLFAVGDYLIGHVADERGAHFTAYLYRVLEIGVIRCEDDYIGKTACGFAEFFAAAFCSAADASHNAPKAVWRI